MKISERKNANFSNTFFETNDFSTKLLKNEIFWKKK